MKKLIVLLVAFSIAAPALADDLVDPGWDRQGPGATRQAYLLDSEPPSEWVTEGWWEDSVTWVTEGWDEWIPWGPDEYFGPGESIMGGGGDYYATYAGRAGVIALGEVWADVENYPATLPGAKWMQVQVTWRNDNTAFASTVPNLEAGFEAEIGEDFYEGYMSYPGEPDWDAWLPGPFPVFEGVELISYETSVLPDGWSHTTWMVYVPDFNPAFDWISMFPSPDPQWPPGLGGIDGYAETVLIDQVVIDTLHIPEPVTVLLLGLGGLLIRRKR